MILIMLLYLSVISSCNALDISKSDNFDLEPYTIALQYLGLDTSMIMNNDSIISNVKVSKIDFLNSVAESGKESTPAWIVTIDSVDFRDADNVAWGVEDNYRKDINMIVDRNSGQLLQVYTEPIHGVNGIEQSIKKDNIDQILSDQIGTIIDIPDSIAPIGFLSAIFSGLGCRCHDAGQVIAYLVNYSERDSPPFPVWILITTGLTGDEMLNRGTDEERSKRKYSYICLVDATTGKWKTITGF